jgi:hypothetical protein
MWKNLSEDLKVIFFKYFSEAITQTNCYHNHAHQAKYFTAARQANDDHKKKYPDYHYNPKEARLRKMWKMQQQQMGHMVPASGHH